MNHAMTVRADQGQIVNVRLVTIFKCSNRFGMVAFNKAFSANTISLRADPENLDSD